METGIEALRGMQQQLELNIRQGYEYKHVVNVIRKMTEGEVKRKLATFRSNGEALKYIRGLIEVEEMKAVPKNDEPTTIEGLYRVEDLDTELAYAFTEAENFTLDVDEVIYFPKSQTELDDDGNPIVPEWLAVEKGLV